MTSPGSVPKLCIFCGSASGAKPAYADATRALVRAMAERGFGLVYGGGSIGLMGVAATTMLSSGGEVVGVIPRTLSEREVAFEGASKLHVVDSMHERKALMGELSLGFITLPGGFGTLEELFEVITWAQLGLHAKPFGIFNIEGYFDGLLRFLDHGTAQGFIRPEYRAMLVVESQPFELLDALATWTPPQPISWLDNEA